MLEIPKLARPRASSTQLLSFLSSGHSLQALLKSHQTGLSTQTPYADNRRRSGMFSRPSPLSTDKVNPPQPRPLPKLEASSIPSHQTVPVGLHTELLASRRQTQSIYSHPDLQPRLEVSPSTPESKRERRPSHQFQINIVPIPKSKNDLSEPVSRPSSGQKRQESDWGGRELRVLLEPSPKGRRASKARSTQIQSFSTLINKVCPVQVKVLERKENSDLTESGLGLKRPRAKKALQDCCWAFCL